MIERIKMELKIAGVNFFILSAAFTAALIILSGITGELLDFYPVCFEVIFPFFVTVVIGEWGKTRADVCFDVIAAQSSSLFRWAVLRYAVLFGTSGIFAVVCMAASSGIRYEMELWELMLLYFPTAFFLSSLCALAGLFCAREHTATLCCGSLWLAVFMSQSLLRLPGVEYYYLFIRYAGDPHGVWISNKAILCGMGLLLWGGIYRKCK